MLPVLLSLLIVLLNLGGIASVMLQFGRGEVRAAVTALVFLAVLDAVGLWLLRGLRSSR